MLDATPLLRFYARRRRKQLASENPCQSQRQQLLALVRKASRTRFGSDHRFSEISDVTDFQQRVPLRRYEGFWHAYWQPCFPKLVNVSWPGTIPYFALTAGTTTGKTKYIPFSSAMSASNHRATLDTFVHHLSLRPESRVLGGKNFMLGGSTGLIELAHGVYAGDLSGIEATRVPWFVRPYFFPPRACALMTDWEQKIEKLAHLSWRMDIRAISGTPSWLLLFFAKLVELRPELPHRLASYYRNLELLIHGGTHFAPYLKQFSELLEGSKAEMREVYPASEGFIAVADRGHGQGLRLITDNGIFYEFVPVDEIDDPAPTRHWLATMETGQNYALILSTCAGLWSYVLGDTVRFIELRPPRLLVTGRLSYFLSAFGEHLIAEEIETAVANAAAEIHRQISDYTVTALFPSHAKVRGRHLYIVEFSAPVDEPQLVAFAGVLDASLARQNQDYKDHRAGDFGMAPPQVLAVHPGTFAAWMKARGQIGGQHKVPRVINDQALFEVLDHFLRQRGSIYAGIAS
jgi:GH3 auxin-responsive promoter